VDGISFTVHPWVPGDRSIGYVRLGFGRVDRCRSREAGGGGGSRENGARVGDVLPNFGKERAVSTARASPLRSGASRPGFLVWFAFHVQKCLVLRFLVWFALVRAV
jgi:hypothetical protein